MSFDRAISIWLTADCWNNRGAALQSLKQWPEALKSFDAALALKPDYAQVWTNRSSALSPARHGTIRGGRNGLRSRFMNSRIPLRAWNERGSALLKLKRFGELLASYDKAVAIAPDKPLGWNNRVDLPYTETLT